MGKLMLKNKIKDLDMLYNDVKSLSKSEVEEKYGYNGQTIRMFLKRNGYKIKTFVEYENDRKFKLFKDLFEENKSISEISNITGWSDDCIYNLFQKRGFDYKEKNLKFNKENIDKIVNYNNIKGKYENEIFTQYDKDNRYAVSNYGRIWSFINKRFLKWSIKKDEQNYGYCYYNINGKNEFKHRITARHFIPNPNNFPEVNHLDSNRENCKWDNLEWTDRSGNIKHALQDEENHKRAIIRAKNAGMKNAKKVLCIEDNKEFNSLSECSRFYGIKNIECISRVCLGKNKYSKDEYGRKLTFKYLEGEKE